MYVCITCNVCTYVCMRTEFHTLLCRLNYHQPLYVRCLCLSGSLGEDRAAPARFPAVRGETLRDARADSRQLPGGRIQPVEEGDGSQ
jgi:hypothetical protein